MLLLHHVNDLLLVISYLVVALFDLFAELQGLGLVLISFISCLLEGLIQSFHLVAHGVQLIRQLLGQLELAVHGLLRALLSKGCCIKFELTLSNTTAADGRHLVVLGLQAFLLVGLKHGQNEVLDNLGSQLR